VGPEVSLGKRKAISDRLRYKILVRDRCSCQFCGIKAFDGADLQVDHLWPVSLGGTNDDWNLATACRTCNAGKGAIPQAWWKARFDRFRSYYAFFSGCHGEDDYAAHVLFLAYFEPLSVWMDGRGADPDYIQRYEEAVTKTIGLVVWDDSQEGLWW
jgi:HNH endonuclease